MFEIHEIVVVREDIPPDEVHPRLRKYIGEDVEIIAKRIDDKNGLVYDIMHKDGNALSARECALRKKKRPGNDVETGSWDLIEKYIGWNPVKEKENTAA